MKLKIALAALSTALLTTGCAAPQKANVYSSDPAVERLAIAAESINEYARRRSQVELANYRQLHGSDVDSIDTSYVPDLKEVVSLGAPWHGPLDEFITKLSGTANYNAPRIIGIKPTGDIMVHIDTDYRSILDMLWDSGTQAGIRADVTVKAKERLIEISYHRPDAS